MEPAGDIVRAAVASKLGTARVCPKTVRIDGPVGVANTAKYGQLRPSRKRFRYSRLDIILLIEESKWLAKVWFLVGGRPLAGLAFLALSSTD
jgi:hypothetical protein